MQANGRITDVLSDILPDRIKKLELINTNAGLGLYSVTIQRDLFKKYQETKSINIIKKYTNLSLLIWMIENLPINRIHLTQLIFGSLLHPQGRKLVGQMDFILAI